jgi:hypothetical protein
VVKGNASYTECAVDEGCLSNFLKKFLVMVELLFIKAKVEMVF